MARSHSFTTAAVALLAAAASVLAGAAGPDLARDRPTRQSSRSQWSRADDARGGVDGVRSGEFGFHTEYEPRPWWEVDLGQPADLDVVRIYNSEKEPQAARTLQVLVSTDGAAWTRVYAHDGSSFAGVPLEVPLDGVRARWVRVQLANTGYLHLNEVEVYGRPVARPRVAATPVPPPAPPVVRATPTPAPFPPAADLTGEWRDDQGATYRVRQVGREVYWQMSAPGGSAHVFRGTIDGDTVQGSWADLPGPNPPRAGTLTLRVRSRDSMVLAGESTLGATTWTRGVAAPPVPSPPPPVRIAAAPSLAYRHPAQESSMADPQRVNDAQAAVDGDPSTQSATAVEADPWWQVDLIDEAPVGQIRVTTAEPAPRLQVLIARDGVSFAPVLPVGAGVFDAQGVPARQVRVQREGTTSLRLSEVEVRTGTPATPAAVATPVPPSPPPTASPAGDVASRLDALLGGGAHVPPTTMPSPPLPPPTPPPAVAGWSMLQARLAEDRSPSREWTLTPMEATGHLDYGEGRRQHRHFVVKTPPPAQLQPGTPFTIAVAAEASDEGRPFLWQDDVAVVFTDLQGGPVGSWATGSGPIVGTSAQARTFTPQAEGRWMVVVPKDAPASFEIRLRVRYGLGVEAGSFGWVTYSYSR